MTETGRIAVLTGQEELRAIVQRLGALAGAEVEAVHPGDGVRAGWRWARLMIVGSDLVSALAAARLPRRSDLVVVATDEPDVHVWRGVVDLGALGLLTLPADEQRLVDLIGEAGEPAAVGSTIAVIGGCGGAGASTFAAALAQTAARLGSTVLIDGDPYAGGLDVLLGAEQRPGVRWPDLATTRGRLGAAALSDALCQVDGIGLLSWDRAGSPEPTPAAAVAVVDAAARVAQRVIVDLPRRLAPASAVLAAKATLAVLVVPTTIRATAAASVVVAELSAATGDLRLVTRAGGAGRLSPAEVAAALGLAEIATVQSEESVAVAAERGEPPLRRARGSLHEACVRVLAAGAAA
jgi:secretion/DNA translocation related CpaE-like protein